MCTLTWTKICAPRELSLLLTPWRWGPTGGWWSTKGAAAFSWFCKQEIWLWLSMTTLPNASPLPLATRTSLLILNVEPSLFLEAYFTAPCGIFFGNTFSSYNLEVIFSLILLNLLNKYANISSALYKKYIHTTTTPETIKPRLIKICTILHVWNGHLVLKLQWNLIMHHLHNIT